LRGPATGSRGGAASSMKFSVVILTWGCERWLETCRASVAAAVARYGGPVEVIEVCNGNGPGAARNEGLDKAKGEYVVFVDADDTLKPDALAGLKDATADIVTFLPPCGTWDLTKREDRAAAFSPMVGNLLAWNAVWRRGAIGGWRFPPLRNYEDLVWTAGMFSRAKTLVSGVAPWYEHREDVLGSLANSYSWRRVRDGLSATGMIRRACRGAHVGLRTRLILARKLTMHVLLHVARVAVRMVRG